MSKPKYLKLLAVVEENYKPISGMISIEDGDVVSDNVLTIKLNDDFSLNEESDEEFSTLMSTFVGLALRDAKERSDE